MSVNVARWRSSTICLPRAPVRVASRSQIRRVTPIPASCRRYEGSIFPPVLHEGRTYQIAQANNALIFRGLGLGVTVAKANRISDQMIAAAADAVARISDASAPGAPLLPPMTDLRAVAAAVAIAVAAAAAKEGLAQAELSDPIQQVHDAMWRPAYPRIELKRD